MISVFGSKVGKEAIGHITESINNQWLGIGPKVKQFEENFSKKLGLKNFAMVDSASNGLYLAIKLLNLPVGSEIIVPSFTFVACAHAVILAGHEPVFCDVDINSYNVTEKTIGDCLTNKTKAIMVVHYAGLPVDMDSIKKFGLPIIEDAAHAVDSYYKGNACGSIGDVGVYSYDSMKNIAIGEGGGITSPKAGLIERAKVLRHCGIAKAGLDEAMDGKERWWEHNIQEVFIRMEPSDISAGIGLAQLEKLNELQAYRKKIWDAYQNAFRNCHWIKTPYEANAGDKHSYFTYCIRVKNKRNDLAKYLFEKGIYTTVRYHPLHMNTIYNSNQILPNCETLNEEAINIPLHPNLTENNVEKIIDDIVGFKKHL